MTMMHDHKAMSKRDKEMIPMVLVRAMFGLALFSLILVAWARFTDRSLVGQPPISEVAQEITLNFARTGAAGGSGSVRVTDADGAFLVASDQERKGFVEVIWRVVERKRMLAGVEGNPPLRLVRFENNRLAILDDASAFTIHLTGYGPDNVAAFATLLP
jgi:putative photosynthetic complex assembly protein